MTPPRTSRRRRALGQHFLRNAAAADQIVAHFAPRPGEPILEIGPGPGVLTDRLLAAGARVIAVEKDSRLAARLASRPEAGSRLTLVTGDALEVDLEALLRPLLDPAAFPKARVLANLPYSVGTAILSRLLMAPALFEAITVMLQREVAERIVAAPGGRTYGSLSVLAQYFTVPRLVMRLAPGSFDPPPKVHSAVVTMTFRSPRELDPPSETAYPPFVRSLFVQRRRTLPHAMGGVWGVEQGEAAGRLRGMGIDPKRRAETLSRSECLLLFHGGAKSVVMGAVRSAPPE